MNFLQLKTDICNEIESTLACYWSSPRPVRQPANDCKRQVTKRDLRRQETSVIQATDGNF
ncbi:MAG TPA: hypothetical protein VJQ59_11630 [Candidatus Sulfotelmatobacter sp.]|nr:hypothetical protein [Candidatus Sulfotelmatobacter sp.]